MVIRSSGVEALMKMGIWLKSGLVSGEKVWRGYRVPKCWK